MIRLSLAFSMLAAIGCASTPPLPRTPTGTEPVAAVWPATFVAAHRELTDGRHANADRALRDFAAAYAGTAEAVEADYWRAVITLDPRNDRGSPREAAALLERYLDSRLPLTHRAEAGVLHRLAASLASPARSAATPAASAPSTDSRDAEIQRLREELENTKAELERIRKRLAPPPAGTTPPPATPPPATPSRATPPAAGPAG